MEAAPIDQRLVRQAVEDRGFDWLYCDQTGSTNADALQHYLHKGGNVVAFAETQSAGRGRRGRSWLSPFARNIYCTVGISREIPMARQGLLSIVTGVALCRALRAQTGLEIALKWPNDLLHDGRKLGGILIESRAHESQHYFFAIGFGINLMMDDEELASLERPATSLFQALGHRPDRNAVLVACIESVIAAITEFEVERVSSLIAEFDELDAYHADVVEVISGEHRLSGVNRGIDESGQLRLETARGIELHSAAEISLRVVDA